MLKRIMHKRERHFAMLNDNRVVRPFEWGSEFVEMGGFKPASSDPAEILRGHSAFAVENSDAYFAAPEPTEFSVERRLYPSAASLSAEELKRPPAQIELS
ncbi:MAG: hypothetical protein QUS14_18890, partial [Pyrinomonadaceae bacterium]|nr:hypothetical protein [Pyrinomonadaceae bacterium]